jgi:LacI family transcriptional regulator
MDDELRYVDLRPYASTFSFVRSSLRAAGTAIVEELVRLCERDPTPNGTLMPARFHMLPGLKTEGLPGAAAD